MWWGQLRANPGGRAQEAARSSRGSVAPIGAGSIKDSDRPFAGIIDLLALQALYFEPADEGGRSAPSRSRGPGAGGAGLARTAVRRPDRSDERDQITTALLEGQDIPWRRCAR